MWNASNGHNGKHQKKDIDASKHKRCSRLLSNKRRLNTAVIYQERASQPHCLARNIKFHRYRNVSFRSQSAVFRPYCDGRR